MSPSEEYHTVRLPKGWTPAKILRFADAVNAIGQAQRLGIENAALRRERRALRKALRSAQRSLVGLIGNGSAERTAATAARETIRDTLKPKARRAGRTK